RRPRLRVRRGAAAVPPGLQPQAKFAAPAPRAAPARLPGDNPGAGPRPPHPPFGGPRSRPPARGVRLAPGPGAPPEGRLRRRAARSRRRLAAAAAAVVALVRFAFRATRFATCAGSIVE